MVVSIAQGSMIAIVRMRLTLVPVIAMSVIVSVRTRLERMHAAGQFAAGEDATLDEQRFERAQEVIVVVERRGRAAASNDRFGVTIERTDLRNQSVAKVVPGIDAPLSHTASNAEGPPLPRRVEHQFAVQHRRRRSTVERELSGHRNTSTPIIESRVTRATSSASVAVAASAGICGNTM